MQFLWMHNARFEISPQHQDSTKSYYVQGNCVNKMIIPNSMKNCAGEDATLTPSFRTTPMSTDNEVGRFSPFRTLMPCMRFLTRSSGWTNTVAPILRDKQSYFSLQNQETKIDRSLY